jgi:hypothetical protein
VTFKFYGREEEQYTPELQNKLQKTAFFLLDELNVRKKMLTQISMSLAVALYMASRKTP